MTLVREQAIAPSPADPEPEGAESAALEAYLRHTQRKRLFLLLALAALGLISAGSMTLGGADLTGRDLVAALLSKVGLAGSEDLFKTAVVWHLRMPRLVMAVIAGAGLSIAGAAMQGVTRNPLVSPFTVGTSSAAAFGASIVIMYTAGSGAESTALIVLGAFVAALGCSAVVFGLSRMRGNSPEALILAGVAMMYLFGAFTSMIHYFASEEDLKAMVSWTFGSLSECGWPDIAVTAGVLIVLAPVLAHLAADLNIMVSSDDESSTSLGVRPSQVRTIVLIASTLLTAAIISFTGIIGFIGLVGPHITRFVIGGDHRFLMPASAVTGACILVGADMIGRTILAPIILPIGIVVSFLGVPLFIYLMMRKTGVFWE